MGRPMIRDLFGKEMTEEEARLSIKRGAKGPTSRAELIQLRIARGLHPHNGFPLGPKGETCGSCANALAGPGGHSKKWYKCALTSKSAYGHPTTDIRVRWPACEKWKPKT
jgi:hypothetical protein